MAILQRQMRLTECQVRYLQSKGPMASVPHPPAGLRASTVEEYAATVDSLLSEQRVPPLDPDDALRMLSSGSTSTNT